MFALLVYLYGVIVSGASTGNLATMPYRFCILSDGNVGVISEAIEAILDQLEREQIDGNFVRGYWHERDDTAGQTIIQNITNSIQNSRFILILIHPVNIESKWWTRNRYMALTHRLNSTRPELMETVIPLLVDDPNDPLPPEQDLPLDIQVLQKLWYNSSPFADFWRKLKNVILDREVEFDNSML